ncbi:MAG: hypothetical protein WBH15_08240, partial [Candidatus Methanoculleus thermohydrogenotrophicum]
GNPHLYLPVEPAVVIHHLKSAADAAATAAVQCLDALSLDARSKNSPIWYVQGEWSIRRHVESLAGGVIRDLAVVCLDYEQIGEFARLIADASRKHPVSILLPNGKRGIQKPLGNASLYVPKPFCAFFQEMIFEKIYCGPIPVEGAAYLSARVHLHRRRPGLHGHLPGGRGPQRRGDHPAVHHLCPAAVRQQDA